MSGPWIIWVALAFAAAVWIAYNVGCDRGEREANDRHAIQRSTYEQDLERLQDTVQTLLTELRATRGAEARRRFLIDLSDEAYQRERELALDRGGQSMPDQAETDTVAL